MTDHYRRTPAKGKLLLSDMKRSAGMKYPEDPEMTFEEGAETLYGCAKARRSLACGGKMHAGELLEHMALCTTTLTGRGSGEARRAWFGADFDDRWVFCHKMADASYDWEREEDKPDEQRDAGD